MKQLGVILIALGVAALSMSCGGRNLGADGDSGVTGTGGVASSPSNDTTPPTVISFSPANGGTFPANAVLVSVTFSEPINTSTVTTSSFHVKNGNNCTGSQLTSAAPVASNSNQTFTITLNASQLVETQQYSTCVTSAITDVAGNALTAASVTWTATAVDTTPPANVTGFTVQPALGRLILSWTNPLDADFAGVRILRKTTNDITDQDDTTAIVACGGNLAAPQATCTDIGLTDGTTYYYKIFSYDAAQNYATGVAGNGTPACGTIEDIRSLHGSPTVTNSRYSLASCTLPQVTVTMVHRDGSNMGFYIQQTQSGAGIFVFTASVNPTTALNLTPGDRITFAGSLWANLCVAAFNQQLQIVKKTGGSVCDGTTTGYTAASFTIGDFTEGAPNANYLAELATTVSGNVTFSTDFTNGADGRLYVFTTPVTITGPVASGVFPASFGGSTTINITNTALVASLLSNGIQFTPGRAVMGRFNSNLELRIYGTGAGGTTNYDGITPGGGENGFGIRNLTYTTAPTISFFSPADGGGLNIGSTQISVGFDQAMTVATVTATSFKVVAGTDCSAAALATTGGITNSNGQKTFTLTLTGGQLVDGNQYTTCVTTAVQNTSSLALATAASATWRASSLTSSFATFESWATANQPTGWVYGTPPSGGSGAGGTAASNITQDTTSPVEGTKAANINSPATTGNGNVLSYATTGTPLAGNCPRIGFRLRGTTTGRTLAFQLQSAGGTAANYCNVGNDQLALNFAAATVIEPASASYTLTDINTGGNWMSAVCRIDNLAGGAMDTFRIRVGNPAAYNISIDDIQFLDNANNPCVPIDTTPPSISTSSPANGATGVAFAPSVSVTFNKAMNVTSVNGAYSVKQTDCSGPVVSTGTPTASGGNTIFTYALTGLAPSTVYAHCVTTGATSAAGTALSSAFSATFTTAALADPTAVTFTPADSQITIGWTNSSNANTGVKIQRATGSEPADCNAGTTVCQGAACNATLTPGSAGRTYVDTGLTNGTQYFYRVCANHTAPAALSTGVTGSATPNNAFNVTAASSTSNTTVTVTFSAAPVTSEAQTAGNYKIVAGAGVCTDASVLSVSAAVLAGNVVTLTTAAQSAVNYKVCVSNVTRNSDSATLTTNNATFTGTGASTVWEDFESWATANQPTGWVYGTPPSGGSGAPGSAATNITQDLSAAKSGSRSAHISATLTGNGNLLSYATTGSNLANACTRIAFWIRGTTTNRTLSIQLQSAGGSANNYCNIGNAQLANDIASASVIAPAAASYTNTAINTGGTWKVAVCRVDNLAGGAMDTLRIRGGGASSPNGIYDVSIDAIQFLDNSNNPCTP
jgi:hypothetical protein